MQSSSGSQQGRVPPSNTRQLPPFAALRAFEAVFRRGGIRRAAEQLGVDHAVISRHIKLLEEWFGVALIARSGNRLTLTPAGKRYHARIAAAFAELTLATEELTDARENAPLRLWCVPGLSIQWLTAQLGEFELETGMRVELKPTDIAPNLSVHEADADIRYYRDDDPQNAPERALRRFELARPEVIPVASPALAAELEAKGSGAILDWPFLHEENDQEWKAWLRLNGIAPPEPVPGALCWHAHLAIAAARQGRGVVLASRFLIEDDLEQGSLVPVGAPALRPMVLGGYVMVAREDRWSMPTLAKLRHFLHARAQPLTALKCRTPQP